MKKILTSILLLCLLGFTASFNVEESKDEPPISIVYNTEYVRGWSDGYAAGWCYGYMHCNPPNPPNCPTPMFNKGETWENYQAGYNRGFLHGKSARERRGF
jgi:hypothetical protein